MIVKELITKLLDYNMNAEISVVAHCRKEEFTLSYGSSEGATKENCDTVSLYVDRLCINEQSNPGRSFFMVAANDRGYNGAGLVRNFKKSQH